MASPDGSTLNPYQYSPVALDLFATGELCISVPRRVVPLMIGALRYLTEPEAWNGDDETRVLAARQLETTLIDLLVSDCVSSDDCPDCPDCPDCGGGGCGGCGAMESEEIMPVGVVIDVRIRDGVLEIRRSPCCEWETVGSVVGVSGPPPDLEEYEPPGGFSACGKAHAIAEIIRDVGTFIWDNAGGNPLTWCSDVLDRFPTLAGGCSAFVEASFKAALWQSIGGLVGRALADVNSPVDWQRFVCRLATQLSASPDPLTGDEYATVRRELIAAMGINPTAVFFWDAVLAGIGPGDLSEFAQLGALNTESDCDCPGDVISIPPPDNLNWLYEVDLRNGVPGWLNLAGESEYVNLRGVVDWPSATGIMKPGVATDNVLWPADCKISYLALRWEPRAGVPYEGNEVRIYPSGGAQFFSGHDPDTDPSGGGAPTKVLLVDYSPSVAGESVRWDVEMRSGNGDDPAYAVFVTYVAIGGTGNDPMLT